MPGISGSRSLIAATSAVFGALAALLAVLPLSFPFPPIPYLKFDIAEIPVVAAFLGFGPLPGFFSAITYWLVLTIVGEFTPIGPAMKFISVASMLLGFWAGYKLTCRQRLACFLAFSLGSLSRVAVTTLANYVVLVILFPKPFLEYAANALSLFLGVTLPPTILALTLILIFTAFYNIIHVALSLFPSIVLVQYMARDGLFLRMREPWMLSIAQRKKLS